MSERPTLDSLHELLQEAAERLDAAATQIRDIPLAPTDIHIRTIGELLERIFRIQHQIYSLRPDLKPAFLRKRSGNSGASRGLSRAIAEASSCEQRGDVAGAIEAFEMFLQSNPPEHLREIAEGEIDKLRGRS